MTEELVTAVCCKEEGDLRHPSKDQEDRRLLDRVPPRLEFWAITTQAQQRKKPSNKSIIHSLSSSRLHSYSYPGYKLSIIILSQSQLFGQLSSRGLNSPLFVLH